MIVYRCAMEQYLPTTLSGEGAARYGGRWNSKGVRVVYAAESRIMAILELVIRQPIEKIAAEFRIQPIQVPDHHVTIDLPKKWRDDLAATRTAGDKVLSDPANLVIKVPSALLSHSYNFLINPLSSRLGNQVKLLDPEPILLDERLLKALRKSK